MKDNKKLNTIIIVSVIVALVAVLGIVGFLLLKKTNENASNEKSKEMFFKYISQGNLKQFTKIEGYDDILNRLAEEPYKTEETLDYNLEQSNEKIKVITKNDTKNNLASVDVTITQPEDAKLTLSFVKNDDLYAMKPISIYKQYMAVKNDQSLNDLTKKLGIEDFEGKLNTFEETSQKISEEERQKAEEKIENTINKYIDILKNNTAEDKFEKIKSEKITVDGNDIDAEGYKLTLNKKEIQNVIAECLKDAKEDKELFDYINTIANTTEQELEFSAYQEAISKLIDNLMEDTEEEDVTLTISVYNNKDELLKTNIKLEGPNDETNNITVEADISKSNFKIRIIVNNQLGISSIEAPALQSNVNNTETFASQSGGVGIGNVNITPDDDTMNKLTQIEQSAINSTKSTTELNINITKNQEGNKTEYDIDSSMKQTRASGEMETSNQVQLLGKLTIEKTDSNNLKISFELEEGEGLENGEYIKLTNNIELTDNLEIEKLKEEDYVLLNDLTEEKLNILMQDFSEKVNEKIDLENSFIVNKLLSIPLNAGLFTKAREASTNTLQAQVKEAIVLAKADILAEYYSNEDNNPNPPSTKEIQEKINSFLNTDIIAVKEPKEPTVDENGTTWIIEIDQSVVKNPQVALSKEDSKLTIDVWKSE